MVQYNSQMRVLVTEGLYGTNRSELLSLAKGTFHKSPTLYGTLIHVFQSLVAEHDEFSGQGLPTNRYDRIMQQLKQPLLDALGAESAGPHQLLDKLNALHSALFVLYR